MRKYTKEEIEKIKKTLKELREILGRYKDLPITKDARKSHIFCTFTGCYNVKQDLISSVETFHKGILQLAGILENICGYLEE